MKPVFPKKTMLDEELAMPLIHTRTFRVRRYECDAYGHVNNANYLRCMQDAAFDAGC